ncbi:hypothetical protein [Sphingobacterium wenxiniae]|uniref:Fibronectin type-III domain-containing protein n=1 Tax=Sphingobacterium wenxiniae TaxID=683125 RepID=A0A1I6PAF3_9SPHI|nr:hypothetical protein [Sphingobacterium wenxiniae]SFS37174.1 hypothetical protein SAMN05660206_101364 [Sphingobacterium wenxiniae]
MAKPNFKSTDAAGMLRYAESILLKMTQNVDLFANPVPDLPTFESLLNTYRDAYAEANFRDKRAVIIKGKAGRELQEAIYRLSQYVDSIAKGDTELIVAAGFIPSSPSTNRIGRTPQAENLRIENVQVGTGKLRARVKAWKHARLYRYEYRVKGTEEWTSILHTKSVLEIRDLEMMQFYEFRATYIGTDTEPNYSDIITAIAV